jgi:hypothetical protein
VTDTDHLKHIFGLPVPKEKRGLEHDISNENSEKLELQEDGVRHIRYLLSAISRDPCENATAFRGQMKIKFTCNGEVIPAEKREEKDLSTATPIPVENSIQLGFHEMEKNNDLARAFIGQPGRRAPCVRCQVYGNSMLTCRLTMSHSNVDFDFVEFFKDAGGVDGLLRSAYPGTYASNSLNQVATTQDLNGVATTNEDEAMKKDPTENLKKAQTTMKLAEHLRHQAEILSQAPITLGKEFIETYFPVDQSDGHYVFCVVCGRSGDLLCCEGCPTVVHADCIGLFNIPDGDWYCKECGHKKDEGSTTAPEERSKDKSTNDAKHAGPSGEEASREGEAERLAPPKSPYPASFQFANARRREIQEQNPGASSHEVSKILSNMWKNAGDDLKQEFMEREVRQREAYKHEIEGSKVKKQEKFDKTSAYVSANAFIARMDTSQKQLQSQYQEKLQAVAVREAAANVQSQPPDEGASPNVESAAKAVAESETTANVQSQSPDEGASPNVESAAKDVAESETTANVQSQSPDEGASPNMESAAKDVAESETTADVQSQSPDEGASPNVESAAKAEAPTLKSHEAGSKADTASSVDPCNPKDYISDGINEQTDTPPSSKGPSSEAESPSNDEERAMVETTGSREQVTDEPNTDERTEDKQAMETLEEVESEKRQEPPEAPKVVEEVDNFDYLAEVMKRAKIASIEDCSKKCKKGVGVLLKKKNAYCHICHNRSDTAYGFACQHDSHNYCTRHVTVSPEDSSAL